MRKHYIVLIAIALGCVLGGCDKIGQTDAGSTQEFQSSIDKMSLEDRVKLEMRSPAPMDQKMAKIKDLYAKAGKPMPADLSKLDAAPATGH